MLANEGEVGLFSRGVYYEPQRAPCARRAGDHKVVDDPAIFVEQLGVALTTLSEVEKICRAERFEKARNGCVVAALDQRLTHMRDVEQASSLTSVEVLGEDPGRVLDRHVVARKRRHARAKLDMQGVQRRLLVGFGHGPAGREQAPAATPPHYRGFSARGRPLCPMT